MEDSVSNLSASLNKLSSSIAPLLSSSSSQNLSLLNRAKLNTLTAYAIESLLFSSLRLSGASPSDLKTHPVMSELARIKQYFEKIEVAEKGRQGPRLRVDKGAAERFVRAGLKEDDNSKAEVERGDQSSDVVHGEKRKAKREERNDETESAKKKKKSSGTFKQKSNTVPKGPKEAFQALLKKAKP